MFEIHPKLLNQRYRIHRAIGSGGISVVYSATDRLTGRPVAIKSVTPTANTILDGSSIKADYDAALSNEFRALISLSHPNLIQFYDHFLDENGQAHFVMEELEQAVDLITFCHKLPDKQKIKYIIQVFDCLTYIHSRQLIHQDIKPENCLVTKGKVKILDLALSVMTSKVRDDSGYLVGTLAYLAPEMLAGMKASISVDLYAAGVMMYELFGHRHPFDINNFSELLNDIAYTTPDVKIIENENIAAIIGKLLAKDPTDRYKSAEDVIQDLKQFL
jgi:serine/threonine protein kinase